MTATRDCCIAGCSNPMHGKGMCRSHYMKVWRGQMPDPGWTPPAKPTPSERFWTKVAVAGPGDCWIWQASFYRNGYGQFDGEGAHRFAYKDRVGPIPTGTHLDHLCHRTQCVNPAHLEPVTAAENNRRGYCGPVAAARMKDHSRERTACSHGHALTPENTYITPTEGWRQCRTCKNERARERRRLRAA